MGQNQLNEEPTPHHVHGRIETNTDRLQRIQIKIIEILNEFRNSSDSEGAKPKKISSSIMDKLVDQSDLILEIETQVNEIVSIVGRDGNRMKVSGSRKE